MGQAEWRHLAVPDVPVLWNLISTKTGNWRVSVCASVAQRRHSPGVYRCRFGMFDGEGIVLYNNEGTPIWACANVMPERRAKLANLKNCTTIPLKRSLSRDRTNTGFKCHPQITWLAHHRSDIYRQASTITMISTGWPICSAANFRWIPLTLAPGTS